jgi:arsenite-transporting ATPase
LVRLTSRVAENPAGSSCLGPLAGLDQQREQYVSAVGTLADPALTTLVLVSRAEPSALREAARASAELAALGVANQRLVVNGLLHDPGDDPTALAFTNRQALALAGAPEQLGTLPVAGVDLVAGELTGLAALRQLTGARPAAPQDVPDTADIDLPGLSELVDELDAAGNSVVMTMGKGGVGKTTLAAAIAIALVDRGHEVTLSTTDPAAHIIDALADTAPRRAARGAHRPRCRDGPLHRRGARGRDQLAHEVLQPAVAHLRDDIGNHRHALTFDHRGVSFSYDSWLSRRA